ncbi:hypothetical protein BSV1_0199 [Borreliella finlandensis]|uniref:Uncharacterized protein n=1 Tax=Borreliella finlandensis TaxID=498741 RepID=A0A826H1D3_9SPIR|nr:hypothetical protein BSV1_0199 [Borreliella finlandensis]
MQEILLKHGLGYFLFDLVLAEYLYKFLILVVDLLIKINSL